MQKLKVNCKNCKLSKPKSNNNFLCGLDYSIKESCLNKTENITCKFFKLK